MEGEKESKPVYLAGGVFLISTRCFVEVTIIFKFII